MMLARTFLRQSIRRNNGFVFPRRMIATTTTTNNSVWKLQQPRRLFTSSSSSSSAPMAVTMRTEEEQLLQESVAQFAQTEIGPLVSEMDHAGELNLELLQKIFDQGLMGIHIPEEFGGSGMSFTQCCIVIEELAKVDPAISVIVDIQNTLINTSLMRFGTPEQQQKWLPRLATNTLASFCLSESSSGSDAFALKTTAKYNETDDTYTINGNKLWISNAKEAGLFLVLANVDVSKGHRGITAFLVEKGTPGLLVGKKEDKLGIRASSTCELVFDNLVVPAADILGVKGEGYKIAIEGLNEGRIGIGAQMLGLAEGAFGHALDYIHERKQFNQRIADFQGVQFDMARTRVDIEAAKLMVYNAARLKDAGEDFVLEAAMCKLYASQAAQRVSTQSLEFFGGVGFTKEYPAEKFYRDAAIGTIYEGTSNLQMQTIAKLLSAKYKK